MNKLKTHLQKPTQDDDDDLKGLKEESFELLNSPLTLHKVATFFLVSGLKTHIISLTTESNVVIPTLRESLSPSLS